MTGRWKLTRILAEVAMVSDETVLVASILHDILEDTTTTQEEIEGLFGDRVLELVVALSDDKALSKEERRLAVLRHLADADRDKKW